MIGLNPSSLCEYLAYWAGGTTLSEVGGLLGYTSRRVQDLVDAGFARQGGATARYDPKTKRWVPSVRAHDLHCAKSVHEAITILSALRLWSRGTNTESMFPVVDARAYQRGPAPDTFRILLGACVRKQVVDVVYLARTRELAVSFSPHTLVVASHRSHFRGYSTFELDGKSHHWDLVPSRVVSAEVRPTLGYVGNEHDADWHAEEMLRLKLRDDVPNTMRQAIQYEYGLVTEQLEIGPVRKALLLYVRADFLNRRYEGFAGPAWDIISDL